MQFIVGFMVGILTLAFIWVIIFDNRSDSNRKEEAIKYHHAYYHPTTGEFTWGKECVK